jgi:hypothetical protein
MIPLGYLFGMADPWDDGGAVEDSHAPGEFDEQLAVTQIAATIRRHLVTVPPVGPPVEGLTDALVLNLARHLVTARDVYGYPRKGEK